MILGAIILGAVARHRPADVPHDPPAFVPAAFACDTESCRQISTPSAPLAPSPSLGGRGERDSCSVFTSGEIDLTGDGNQERVKLDEGVITIFQDDNVVWQSPSAWTVVDPALGDPNNDGRYEIIAAFWRDDAEGVPRNQPFIIGYRQGLYRTLWGGSPIAEPIVELALADVTGDGVEELIVLEAAPGGEGPVPVAATVAVWRWHGWGFSRMWRSEEGRYRELSLVPGVDGDPATFAVHASLPD